MSWVKFVHQGAILTCIVVITPDLASHVQRTPIHDEEIRTSGHVRSRSRCNTSRSSGPSTVATTLLRTPRSSSLVLPVERTLSPPSARASAPARPPRSSLPPPVASRDQSCVTPSCICLAGLLQPAPPTLEIFTLHHPPPSCSSACLPQRGCGTFRCARHRLCPAPHLAHRRPQIHGTRHPLRRRRPHPPRLAANRLALSGLLVGLPPARRHLRHRLPA